MTDPPTRRRLLGALAAGAIGVAGCLDGGSNASGETTDAGETDTGDSDPDGDGGDEGTGGDGDGSEGDGTDGSDGDGPTWRTTTLEDVRTGEAFAIGDFDRPVLLETFAVWCSTCLSQQRESQKLHERIGDDVVTIGLNVDQNEDAAQVREHAEEHGFDWRYAISPPQVTRSLTDEFGQSMANPPSAPVVLACPDGGARRLEDGVKEADVLESEVENGC